MSHYPLVFNAGFAPRIVRNDAEKCFQAHPDIAPILGDLFGIEPDVRDGIYLRASMSDEELDVLNGIIEAPDPIDALQTRGGF